MNSSKTKQTLVLLNIAWLCLSAAASDILEYYILEELAPHRVVGDLVNDFGFADKYDRATVEFLRFSVLKQAAYDRRFFSVNETSGIITTTHRIDRELICRGDDDCVIKFDVAVKPMQFFQIIKVLPPCSICHHTVTVLLFDVCSYMSSTIVGTAAMCDGFSFSDKGVTLYIVTLLCVDISCVTTFLYCCTKRCLDVYCLFFMIVFFLSII